jgi:F-type H+-transporting ATPase subunit b
MKIDFWTLGLQTLNILILLFVLQYFFWKPVAAMIAQRKALAGKTAADRLALQKDAAAADADTARIRAGFAAERIALLEAGRARDTLLAQAKTDAAALQSAAEARAAVARDAARKSWSDRSTQFGVEIARRLVARLPPEAAQAAFLDWLVQAIAALPATARAALADRAVSLSVVSAVALTEVAQAQATGRIGAALGYRPQISYATDPALIAGLELHAPHLAVSNSFRADLGAILESLDHDH